MEEEGAEERVKDGKAVEFGGWHMIKPGKRNWSPFQSSLPGFIL